ncbi:MAG TPA: DUF885 domain-containing protein [Candidatus Eisenbacteria bacterium]|nr:DUF885 domain-containing protein [Candidatus Eisenbacteria bacterium]
MARMARRRMLECAGVVFCLWTAVPGVSHAAPAGLALGRICKDYWEGTLAANPTMATALGERRYDARLADISPAGIARERARLERVLASARALDAGTLSADERVTRAVLLKDVQDQLDALSCRNDEWLVDSQQGPQVALPNLSEITVIETPAQAADYVQRCRAIPRYMDQHIANLRRGIAARRVPPASVVRRVMRQLAGLRRPVETWALLRPLEPSRDGWPAGAAEAFRRDLTQAVRDSVQPAFERYRVFLDQVMLRAARSDEHPGLSRIPGGPECYRAQIRIQTSLDLDPAQVHQIGLEQVARVRQEFGELGARVFGTAEFATLQQRLREDSTLYFANGAEVEARARASLTRAQAALPRWFLTPPRAACEVKVMEGVAPSVLPFYQPPVPDGARPGYYLINTVAPRSRRRFEAEALAYHEGIPGHHVQVAIAQELTGLPAFRRHLRVTAFAEGWALYAERLADEMGLYSDPVDRLGMLAFDLWRSARLVVDTGLHSQDWTIEEAEAYMTDNTLLPVSEIHDEIDRYLSWPGQALAYKVGQLEILKLREEGKQRLGERFDIKGFHDAVLRNGAVALPVLREQVEAWYARVEAAK